MTPPHTTVATEHKMALAKKVEKKRESWKGCDAKKMSVFLSNQRDYEAIDRTEIRDEVRNILEGIKSCLAKT